ncbi:MAG: hypothetical protein MST07_10340, partial [Firmicutes bacterium]|nr:hypothetical protein [Bacillota bacterium]
KYNPLLFDRVYSIQFITAYFTRKFYSPKAICWRTRNSIKELSKVYEDKLLQELKDLANFCSERELKCQIVLIQRDYQSIERIYAQVQNWADVMVVSSPRELNNVIRA